MQESVDTLSKKQKKKEKFLNIYKLYKEKNWNGLEKNIKTFNPGNAYQGFIAFFRGKVAEQQKNYKKAKKAYKYALMRYPYNIINEAVDLNPNSVPLRKLYCIQSLRFGIPFFAEGGLENLKPHLSQKEFRKFKEGPYQKALKEYEKENEVMQEMDEPAS